MPPSIPGFTVRRRLDAAWLTARGWFPDGPPQVFTSLTEASLALEAAGGTLDQVSLCVIDVDARVRPIAHVRVKAGRPDRRIAASGGTTGGTLCGAAITAYDSTWSEARRFSRADREHWIGCRTCREAIAGAAS